MKDKKYSLFSRDGKRRKRIGRYAFSLTTAVQYYTPRVLESLGKGEKVSIERI